MSATLGTLLHELQPDWKIVAYERLSDVAEESSHAFNNAGTGHAALCELNYTPEAADGSVDVSKAVSINEQFQLSRQFWSSLVDRGVLNEPDTFINPTPHMTFVRGEKNVSFLKTRYEALSKQTLFADMVVRKGMSATDARKSLLSTEPFQNYPALVAALDRDAGDAENANEGAQ